MKTQSEREWVRHKQADARKVRVFGVSCGGVATRKLKVPNTIVLADVRSQPALSWDTPFSLSV
ncbi:hypothetical protein J7M23_05050 [Candidatus Sumerlaeota bacterium]|nr:hypothetical protein [Candidatus Sumerlaeota bacterium]